MRVFRLPAFAAVACCLAMSAPSFAEPPAPAASAPAPVPARPGDAVLLRDGTLMRGTIMELLPGRTVRVVLDSGETRVIPMDTVAYAGPAAGLATSTPPPGAPLELRANKTGVTFYWRGDSARVVLDGDDRGTAQSYRRICTAPCEASLPPGTYLMALSSGHDKAVAVEEPVVLEGPSSIHGTHRSYTPLRVIGTIIVISSVVSGLYLIGRGVLRTTESCDSEGTCSTEPDVDLNDVLWGTGILIGGGTLGGILQGKDDSATIRVAPLAQPRARRLPGGAPGHDALSASPALVTGLSVSAVF